MSAPVTGKMYKISDPRLVGVLNDPEVRAFFNEHVEWELPGHVGPPVEAPYPIIEGARFEGAADAVVVSYEGLAGSHKEVGVSEERGRSAVVDDDDAVEDASTGGDGRAGAGKYVAPGRRRFRDRPKVVMVPAMLTDKNQAVKYDLSQAERREMLGEYDVSPDRAARRVQKTLRAKGFVDVVVRADVSSVTKARSLNEITACAERFGPMTEEIPSAILPGGGKTVLFPPEDLGEIWEIVAPTANLQAAMLVWHIVVHSGFAEVLGSCSQALGQLSIQLFDGYRCVMLDHAESPWLGVEPTLVPHSGPGVVVPEESVAEARVEAGVEDAVHSVVKHCASVTVNGEHIASAVRVQDLGLVTVDHALQSLKAKLESSPVSKMDLVSNCDGVIGCGTANKIGAEVRAPVAGEPVWVVVVRDAMRRVVGPFKTAMEKPGEVKLVDAVLIPGDSGSPYVGRDGRVVAVHVGAVDGVGVGRVCNGSWNVATSAPMDCDRFLTAYVRGWKMRSASRERWARVVGALSEDSVVCDSHRLSEGEGVSAITGLGRVCDSSGRGGLLLEDVREKRSDDQVVLVWRDKKRLLGSRESYDSVEACAAVRSARCPLALIVAYDDASVVGVVLADGRAVLSKCGSVAPTVVLHSRRVLAVDDPPMRAGLLGKVCGDAIAKLLQESQVRRVFTVMGVAGGVDVERTLWARGGDAVLRFMLWERCIEAGVGLLEAAGYASNLQSNAHMAGVFDAFELGECVKYQAGAGALGAHAKADIVEALAYLAYKAVGIAETKKLVTRWGLIPQVS